METIKTIGIKIAVDTLIEALKTDPSYRESWKANIAMSFVDAAANKQRKKRENWRSAPLNRRDIHEAANEAADRFLTNLCR